MRDPDVIGSLKRQGGQASTFTSLCSGSPILGGAGCRPAIGRPRIGPSDKLAAFGATPGAARVVMDRNRITGGGVTAGIDFALETDPTHYAAGAGSSFGCSWPKAVGLPSGDRWQ
jgi:cyclohexyl-isocyanide hydratase